MTSREPIQERAAPAVGDSAIIHTPGPWVGFSDRGRTVAIMPAGREGDICQFSVPPTEKDANLMIAAPDLVEPWEAALDSDWDYLFKTIPDSGHGQFWKDILRKHRAAILKAVGDRTADATSRTGA